MSVLSLSIGFLVCFLLFIRTTFCVVLICICIYSVSWLFSLSCQYLSGDLPERLRTPIRGKEIISTKPRPKSAYGFFGLVYCFIVTLRAVYCNRSCLWVCNGRAGGVRTLLHTASARSVCVSLSAFSFYCVFVWSLALRNIFHVPVSRCECAVKH